MATFADRAREVMEAKGLGSNELNRAMGKDMGFMSNLLKRKAPQIDTMQLLAKALGVHLEWLTTGRGPRDLADPPPSAPAAGWPLASGFRPAAPPLLG